MSKKSSEDEYKKNAENIARIKAHMDAATESAWKQYKAQHPEDAEKYGFKAEAICYKKRPPGFAKVLPRLMERMLWKGGAAKTQKLLLDEVRADFPDQKILPNIWTNDLVKWQRDKITTLIRGNMATPISITGCKTLSEVKKRLLAATETESAEQSFKVTVSISDNVVVVGKKTYPIEHKKSGQYDYKAIRLNVGDKRQWLRLDALIAFLH